MPALLEATLTHFPLLRRGKVRDVFDLEDCYLMVVSDRISAFDVIMQNGIPDKGILLNQLSAFWFKHLSDVCPNHVISTDDQMIAEAIRENRPELHGRSMLVKKAEPFPVECVVRGRLAGSWWKDYAAGQRNLFDHTLPEGMLEGAPFPQPIFTPATKAESGHDENISVARMASIVGEETTQKLETLSLTIFQRAARLAESQGLILADTKFEFGLMDGEIIWIDEALTPDSSRYWDASTWKLGETAPSYDKQFVRDYLETLDWNKQPPGPTLPDNVVEATRAKYVEAYRRLTGHDLAL